MPKFTLAACVVLLALLTWPDESAACRRKWRHGCCPTTVCSPVSCHAAQPRYAPWAPPASEKKITTAKGRVHRVIYTGEKGDFEHERAEPLTAVGAVTDVAPEDIFRGKVRRVAKLSISDAKEASFASVSALLKTLVPDKQMAKNAAITHDPTSDRTAEENRNVTLSAFLYALLKEDDNDYHVILGDNPDLETVRYVNVEVSGLPPAGPFKNRLTQVRTNFKSFFNDQDAGILQEAEQRYVKFEPPIRVQVSGSLFWDIEHPPPKTVGPTDHKPQTAWEIHPVTTIEFNP
jgi:hypothetical protein